jgi:hypothetical protein
VNQDENPYMDDNTYIVIENAHNEEKLGPKAL